ncbi:MAG: hypothetical protein ACE5JS_20165, partial [Nitrospinota bacterium]
GTEAAGTTGTEAAGTTGTEAAGTTGTLMPGAPLPQAAGFGWQSHSRQRKAHCEESSRDRFHFP